MRLQKLLAGLDYQLRGSPPVITGLNYDSRKIRGGDLFAAIRGFDLDGHDFVQHAEQNGAAAVMVERWIPNLNTPQILVKNTRQALAIISANFYGHPAEKLRVLGVTGTNGKTTCTYLIKSILEAAGYKAGLVGTIQVLTGARVATASRTTPESLDLQKLLAEMAGAGQDFAALEVSSHALELERVKGLPFKSALFTNLSQDHLNFHRTLEQYFASKLKLFKDLQGPAVLNFDDRWGREARAHCSGRVLSYGIERPSDFRAENIRLEKWGVSYILSSEAGRIPINLRLAGYFNVYNSLGAAAVCWGQGVDLDKIKSGLELVPGVPGRFERIENERGLNVVVDYAHTPDGLENVLKSARRLVPKGRLILVFGAGGDRDRAKRPLMGAAAARLADLVIVTSDNPRTEDPLKICAHIEAGLLTVDPPVCYEIIVDRRRAIRKAVNLARPGDLVVVAGKGHETYQEFSDRRIHFDDRNEVRMAIKELKD